MTELPSVVLWGAGMISGAHAAACHSLGWPIVAVASRSPERARARAAEVGALAAGYDELLARRAAELAVVCTPPARHAADVVRLLNAGYHVVVEKPLATTLRGADEMIATERRVGRPALYAENLASSPAVQALLARLPHVGTPTHVSARAVQAAPTWTDMTTSSWGGGALFDMGSHPVALVLLAAMASGLGAPTSVSARLQPVDRDDPASTDGDADVRLGFAGGLTASLAVGWRAEQVPTWDLQLAGDTDVLRIDLFPSPTLEHNGEPVALHVPDVTPRSVAEYGYRPQLGAYWYDVSVGRTPVTGLGFGRAVLDVICGAYWSAGRDGELTPLPFRGPRDRNPFELWRGEITD